MSLYIANENNSENNMETDTSIQKQSWAGDRKLRLLIYLTLILAALALLSYANLTLKESKFINTSPSTISVNGTGEAVAVPDIATFSFSVLAEAKDAADAQDRSAESINSIIAFLKENGVEKKDIKTLSYNLSPKYEYIRTICSDGFCPPGRQNLIGYMVSQTIEIKVRDTGQAGDIISGVGGLGATNVSSLRFIVDDDEKVKDEARSKAIADAKEKAKTLADDLRVRLVRLTDFYENQPGPYYGYDGEVAISFAESGVVRAVPDIPVGENKIVSNVTLVYEIR